MESPTNIVVVLTILPEEFGAIAAHLTEQEMRRVEGTIFEIGRVEDEPWHVAIAQVNPGGHDVISTCDLAIREFSPLAIFLVGVAGALKDDVALGDVIVGTHIHAYQGRKEVAGKVQARPRGADLSYELGQIAQHVNRTGRWRDLLPAGAASPNVHFKPIAAGETLIADADGPSRAYIDEHHNDSVAIEMESHGLVNVINRHRDVDFLVLRGVSDHASHEKSNRDAEGWQPRAAANAAAMAIAIIRQMQPTPSVETVVSPTLPAETWAPGACVTVADAQWMLTPSHWEERLVGDGAATLFACRVLDLGLNSYGWLRRVRVDHDAPNGYRALSALRTERLLADQLVALPAAPKVRAWEESERAAVLVYSWPVENGALWEPLSVCVDDASALAPWEFSHVLSAVPRLCDVLTKLHELGHAHLRISAHSILLNSGLAMFRDLGAAVAADLTRGEPMRYRPPELGRAAGRPGPGTDVYQLAALLYDLACGTPPDRRDPVPIHTFAPGVPEELGAAVDQSLSCPAAERMRPKDFKSAVQLAVKTF